MVAIVVTQQADFVLILSACVESFHALLFVAKHNLILQPNPVSRVILLNEAADGEEALRVVRIGGVGGEARQGRFKIC